MKPILIMIKVPWSVFSIQSGFVVLPKGSMDHAELRKACEEASKLARAEGDATAESIKNILEEKLLGKAIVTEYDVVDLETEQFA
jgi:hypothetical protein